MATTTLDASGLNCPLPVIMAKKAMKGIAVGDILQIEATDPGTVKDFQVFCRTTGHEMVAQSESNGLLVFQIRRAQ